MNKFIKKELEKCKIAAIPPFDDTTTYIKINRGELQAKKELLAINGQYSIIIDKSLVEDCEWYHTIHDNWNKGKGPDDIYLNVEVVKKIGKMIYVKSVGVNSHTLWEGYIPQGNIRNIDDL